MSFCQRCGANVENNPFCSQCGHPTNAQPPVYEQPPVRYVLQPVVPDAPSTGIAVISFLFPLVGLILYLVYHDTKPQKADSAAKGALWGFFTPLILGLALSIITLLLV